MLKGQLRQRTVVETQRGEGTTKAVLRFIVRPVRQADDGALMIVVEDITQQRMADAARNAFVAQATHELRTPLTNIRLYVETALDEGQRDVQILGQCLSTISQEVMRLDRLVSDILSISEIESV